MKVKGYQWNKLITMIAVAVDNNKRKEVIKMEKDVKRTKMVGEGVGFDRIRRITGYLVGTLDRFNNAKKAEVADRVTHGAN